jgi:alkanesulfonate monooxygenase SsuD/methylene tetrahydromethanopterin reductase-like flavin-dependent oxidoreductase (luciferase family)
MDPFIALTYAAARTSRIRLATGICLVPEHNPLALAKVIASLDRLSGGRFALGVGIGWSAEEFQALGLMFERRAQRTHEYIDVMRQLWSEEISNFTGEFVSFQGVRSYPSPRRAARSRLSSGARAGRRCGGSPNTAPDGSAST